MSDAKRLCTLSIDLDNEWSYLKVHGDAQWKTFPSYLGTVIPRVLEVCADHDFLMTYFIVGQDAVLPQHRDPLRMISQSGHEVGNHSFDHNPWFQTYSEHEVEAELLRAHEAITQATGVSPKGFRGPGFSCTEIVREKLARAGYEYDCSTFPTFLGPLARLYYLFHSNLRGAELEKRKELFGSWRDVLRPNRAYYLKGHGYQLLEIPVSTMPYFRIPIHVSYLLYLSTYSNALARRYFEWALMLFRVSGISPSILLHPLDFIGGDECASLSFFPAMQMKTVDKLKFLHWVITTLQRDFEIMPMLTYKHRLESEFDVDSDTIGKLRRLA